VHSAEKGQLEKDITIRAPGPLDLTAGGEVEKRPVPRMATAAPPLEPLRSASELLIEAWRLPQTRAVAEGIGHYVLLTDGASAAVKNRENE